ncbi:MAG: hypothetical protein KJS83_10300, partial [Xanthomonadaceae bacterium]|nr:hypothetical protein [Xanthomonadaceae bacterium]
MQGGITPSNIVGAALLMQLSIFIIVSVALAILPEIVRSYSVLRGDEYTRVRTQKIYWIVLALFLITLVLLLFSDAFAAIWGPMYRIDGKALLTWSTSLMFVFLVDYLLLGALCYFTGLSGSPFITIIIALPALAIFLRESIGRVCWYAVISASICMVFTYLNDKPSGREMNIRWKT